jgi:hypothetical protein
MGLVINGRPAELRLDSDTHCPICGATPPPTTMKISSGVIGATKILRSLGALRSVSSCNLDSPYVLSFCQS